MSAHVIVSCYTCDEDVKLSAALVRIVVPVTGDYPFYSFTCPGCDTYALRVLPRQEIFENLRRIGVPVLTPPAELEEHPTDALPISKDELLTFCLELKTFTHLEENLVEE